MKIKFFIVFLILTLTVFGGILGYEKFELYGEAQEITDVEAQIAAANYCKIASDCVAFYAGGCPFGCGEAYINKAEKQRLSLLTQSYFNNTKSRCMYDCISPPKSSVECIAGTCVAH